jgi:hypothetical protein
MSTVNKSSPQHQGETSNPDAARKLWFDYLAKLNDRSLQKTAASGATTWVLLGVAGAILYKIVPQLPHFLSLHGILGSTSVVFLLEVDSTLCFESA